MLKSCDLPVVGLFSIETEGVTSKLLVADFGNGLGSNCRVEKTMNHLKSIRL